MIDFEHYHKLTQNRFSVISLIDEAQALLINFLFFILFFSVSILLPILLLLSPPPPPPLPPTPLLQYSFLFVQLWCGQFRSLP
jgi:hypothetical protein